MDPAYADKKIIDLSEEELVVLGYLGENAVAEIRRIVEQIRKVPEHLGNITCSIIDLFKEKYPPRPPPAPPAISEAEILYSQLINDPEAHTVVAPDLVSKYEMNFWYHGVFGNPRRLLWRSDFETNPFPIPASGTQFSNISNKMAHGLFSDTPIKLVWDDVAPKILAAMKVHGLESMKFHGRKQFALEPVRFSIFKDDRETFGPIVLWIELLPNSSIAGIRDATTDILRILADAHITDVGVEWYERPAVKSASPSLASAEDSLISSPSRSA